VTGRPGPAAWAEKHLANPPLRALLRLGLAPRAFALLETTGRRTGRRRLTPVGGAVTLSELVCGRLRLLEMAAGRWPGQSG
jgi:hypothetical protein